MAAVNTKALELARIGGDTPDPPGGEIERDPVGGKPTGVLKDEAAKLVERAIPPPTKEESLKGLQKACEIAVRGGCTSIHERGVDSDGLSIYQTALQRSL